MVTKQSTGHGFTLLELMAAVSIISIISTLIVLRLGNHNSGAKAAACHTNQGEIELQCQLWRRRYGSFPSANLSNPAASAAYFPDGLPVCPVDGSSYTIDTNGRVVGHNH